MDILCIEQCVKASFDRDVCMSCERTRPLIVVDDSEFTDNVMLSEDLQRIASTEIELGKHKYYVL